MIVNWNLKGFVKEGATKEFSGEVNFLSVIKKRDADSELVMVTCALNDGLIEIIDLKDWRKIKR